MGQSRKLLPQWKGPFVEVMEVISPLLYRVVGRKREYVKHHDKLRICEDRDIPLWMRWIRQLILTTEEPATDLTLGDDLLDGVEALFRPGQPNTLQDPVEGGTPRVTRRGRQQYNHTGMMTRLIIIIISMLQMDITDTDSTTTTTPRQQWRGQWPSNPTIHATALTDINYLIEHTPNVNLAPYVLVDGALVPLDKLVCTRPCPTYTRALQDTGLTGVLPAALGAAPRGTGGHTF